MPQPGTLEGGVSRAEKNSGTSNDRKVKKAAKQAKLGRQREAPLSQLPPPHPAERSFHTVQEIGEGHHPHKFTAMTFNILAQALVKRELFPHAGDMLKWKIRRRMIMEEIEFYKPDIMCLQEVDNYTEFYREALGKLGYESLYFKHHTKQHGCMIAYMTGQFDLVNYTTVDYDTDILCPATQKTGNIAQLLALRWTHDPQRGVIVGNTHLYWKRDKDYERLRQSLIYATRFNALSQNMKGAMSDVQWSSLLTGDFNSSPSEPVYNMITGRAFTEDQMAQLEASRQTIYAEGENAIEAHHEPWTVHDLLQSDQLCVVHCNSVYSHYRAVDCAMSDKLTGEPAFTNYTQVFKGTLDYIFIDPGLVVSKILALPPNEYLTPALPNRHYGSDHLCLVTQLGFSEDKGA